MDLGVLACIVAAEQSAVLLPACCSNLRTTSSIILVYVWRTDADFAIVASRVRGAIHCVKHDYRNRWIKRFDDSQPCTVLLVAAARVPYLWNPGPGSASD